MKELKWKHDNYCTMHCVTDHNHDSDTNGLEVLTPYPKKRNGLERKLNRYNHIMEFVRTILAFTTLTLQLIILYRLFN